MPELRDRANRALSKRLTELQTQLPDFVECVRGLFRHLMRRMKLQTTWICLQRLLSTRLVVVMLTNQPNPRISILPEVKYAHLPSLFGARRSWKWFSYHRLRLPSYHLRVPSYHCLLYRPQRALHRYLSRVRLRWWYGRRG